MYNSFSIPVFFCQIFETYFSGKKNPNYTYSYSCSMIRIRHTIFMLYATKCIELALLCIELEY